MQEFRSQGYLHQGIWIHMEGSAGQMNQDGPESFSRSPKGIADWIVQVGR